MTALSQRQRRWRVGYGALVRYVVHACLGRHVRLVHVPADHVRVHGVNRLDAVILIMGYVLRYPHRVTLDGRSLSEAVLVS